MWMVLLIALGSSAMATEQPSLREYQRRPYVLTDADVQQIKEEIRMRCNLPKASEITYPWYYHYELGVALQKHKDWQRSLDSLIASLDRRDRPQKFTRIYGMWFIDYYPYYNIGVAHYNLQNWKCAVQSFQLSRMFEDLRNDSVESFRLRELQTFAEQKLDSNP